MSGYAEPTPLPVTCPTCEKQGKPSSYPGYHDLFNGERVIRASCIMHGHPVIDRCYAGTAKSNWGTVGHGPVTEAEPEEHVTEPPTPAELERAEREALEEMRAGDAAEA